DVRLDPHQALPGRGFETVDEERPTEQDRLHLPAAPAGHYQLDRERVCEAVEERPEDQRLVRAVRGPQSHRLLHIVRSHADTSVASESATDLLGARTVPSGSNV